MVANAKDITTERKIDLFQVMMNQKSKAAPSKQKNIKKLSTPQDQSSKKIVTEQAQIQSSNPVSIVQNMDKSPGGVQIGKIEGPLIINQEIPARKLTYEQKKIFVNTLRQYPVGEIIVEIKGPDREPNEYANELTNLLKEAGWKILGTPMSLYPKPEAKGMALLVHSRESAPQCINYIYKAFQNIGINIHAEIANTRPKGSLTLAIGYIPNKPSP